MKSKFTLLIFFILLVSTRISHANVLESISYTVQDELGVERGISNTDNNILNSQRDVESLMKQVNGSLIGSYGWGGYQYHDYQSYGNSANKWSDVMNLISSGSGSGDLAQTVTTLAREFPIDINGYNQGVSDPTSRQYYADQSKTVLATRAASQLDYDKIQDQIAYQQMLQQKIDNTDTLKSALDLNNRIQVESNLINLEILRQSALSNQQQAIVQQGSLIHDLTNARFLTKQ